MLALAAINTLTKNECRAALVRVTPLRWNSAILIRQYMSRLNTPSNPYTGVKQPDLATRLTAELAPAVDEDGDVVAGIRFFLDGEPLYPETAEFLDSVEDGESLRARLDGYLRSRGIQDPHELYRLVAIWRQFYLASSYELPTC